jgi:hypothetical protein
MARKPRQTTAGDDDVKTLYGKAVKPRATKYYQRSQRDLEKGLALLRDAPRDLAAGALTRPATKGNFPLEGAPPGCASLETPAKGVTRRNSIKSDDAQKIKLLLEDRLKWIDLKEGEAAYFFGIIDAVLTHVGKSSDVYALRFLGMEKGAAFVQEEEHAKDEGFLNKALATVLTSWGVPEKDFEATAAELERVARARAIVATGARRPKWDERGKYAELKDLSAPKFLKQVYGDVIAPDGTVNKKLIRDMDAKLMASVEVYLSARKSRQQSDGDAAGLRLIAGVTSPLRRVSHG